MREKGEIRTNDPHLLQEMQGVPLFQVFRGCPAVKEPIYPKDTEGTEVEGMSEL